ncbi:MAG: hypothetical protein AB8B64_03055 [Granulosicoccus sp.]
MLAVSAFRALFRFNLFPLVFLAVVFSSLTLANDVEPLDELAAPCLACHSLDPDTDTHVGPSLAGIAGRALGADCNYTYSEAFTKKASTGLVWDRESLDRFLKHPQSMVEGTAMSYPGVPDSEHRSLLLDWLMSDPSGKAADLVNANFSRDPEVKAVLDIVADTEYGEYLAGECLTCHQADDANGGVPPIHKLTRDYFIYALLEYQNGARSNRVMQTISGALGTEELAALSAVFSQTPTE